MSPYYNLLSNIRTLYLHIYLDRWLPSLSLHSFIPTSVSAPVTVPGKKSNVYVCMYHPQYTFLYGINARSTGQPFIVIYEILIFGDFSPSAPPHPPAGGGQSR